MIFPVSEVEIFPLWPPLVALAVSFFSSMGGVSGAFLLLPFQVSILGFTSPAVSSTNLVFNIVAIPSGVWRYLREGRMSWPLTWIIVTGTLPGVFVGFFIRIRFLPDPRVFKLFVGLVLLYIGARLVLDVLRPGRGPRAVAKIREEAVLSRRKAAGPTGRAGEGDQKLRVSTLEYSWQRVTYEFSGQVFSFNVPGLFLLALAVGIIGGAYGIGGGAIIAPFIVTFFKLPIHTVAGAALSGTFLTSVAGVAFYGLLGPTLAPGLKVGPDWLLGCLFGLGGLAGMYLGARCQKRVPERVIKAVLALALLMVALRYVIRFFL